MSGRHASLSEAQIQFFRDSRAHLAGPGAVSPAAAARAILGAQAQQEWPGLFALSLRTQGRPALASMKTQLLDSESRSLVRTWGQRDTLHIYDPEDWSRVVAARAEWPQSGRRGGMPSEPDVEMTRKLFEQASRPLLRTDLFEHIPKRFIDEIACHPGVVATGGSPVRFAATRMIWRLALAGDVCFAEKHGVEQSYAHRPHWFPNLSWNPASDPAEAAIGLARRYLATYGPAAPVDLAHFFGANVRTARNWMARLEGEIVAVHCGSRKELFALRDDIVALEVSVPRGYSRWPVRLLPKWDTQLMRHADKSWLMPVEDERPLVWRKAGDISATVLARGRIVAIWSYKAGKKKVVVSVQPLSGWRKSVLPGVRLEARALAAFLRVPGSDVEVASP